MAQSRSSAAHSIIADLARPPKLDALHPIAARFVYSVRLIALHERAGRDPVPELAARLGSVNAAAKSLALAKAVTRSWPENIQVSRFCCGLLSHDEAALGALVAATANRNRAEFDKTIIGLVRPDRIGALWDASADLVAAEFGSG